MDVTMALNVHSSRTIARLAREVGAHLVYISTDYVFDGTSPPHAVDAVPNPLSTYGLSKLQGSEPLYFVYYTDHVKRKMRQT
jgi:dTDP-4-dehydrorhamnose reductase